MPDPTFLTDGYTPNPNSSQLQVQQKILGAIRGVGIVRGGATGEPEYYPEGITQVEDDNKMRVLTKILAAIRGT